MPEVSTPPLEPEPAQADSPEAAPDEAALMDSEPSGKRNQFCGKVIKMEDNSIKAEKSKSCLE